MALVFMDGFDTVQYPQLSYSSAWDTLSKNPKWFSYGGVYGSPVGSVVQPGRYGGLAINFSAYSGNMGVLFPTTTAVGIAGLAAYIITGDCRPLSYYDSANNLLAYIVFNALTNSIDCYRYDGFLYGSAPTGSCSVNTWNYIEFKLNVNSTTGLAQVQINGALVISYAGNTQGTGTSSISGVRLQAQNNASINWNADDFYVCDGTAGPGSYPCNSFLGDVQIITKFPTANGSVTNFATNGTSNWQTVSNTIPLSNTFYNYSNTVGNQDLFTTDTITSTYQVLAVTPSVFALKDAGGSRSIANEVKLGSTTVTSTGAVLPSSGTFITNILPINPVSSVSWTVSDINSLQFGYKLTA